MSEQAEANTPGPSEEAQTMTITVEIVVEPPLIVGVQRRLIPPVVARTEDQQLLEDYLAGKKQVFGTLMLTASNGNDKTSLFSGNNHATGQPVTVPSSSSGSGGGSSSRHRPHEYIYFIFTGLSITQAGIYTIRVCVNELDVRLGYLVTVGEKVSQVFDVVNGAVAPARPSKLIDFPHS